jgi:hypothetical protein
VKILNQSLFLHTSIDSNFDTIERGKLHRNTNLRISVLYLPLGTIRLYILTFKIHRNKNTPLFCDINLWHTIKFNKIQKTLSIEELSKRTNDYEDEILTKINKSSLTQQEEFLKIRISENQNSMANTLNKSGYHTTVILAYAAVFTFTYTQYLEIETNIYISILVCYLTAITLFEIINLFLFLKKSVEVRGTHRSSFMELKISKKHYALAKSLYFDWQSTTTSLTYTVGLARNTEQSSLKIIALGLLILFVVTVSPKKTNKPVMYNSAKSYYIVNQETLKKGAV